MGRFFGPAADLGIVSGGTFGGAAAAGATGQFIVVAANNITPGLASAAGASVRDSAGIWHALIVTALGARGAFGAWRDTITTWAISTNSGPGNAMIGRATDGSTIVTATDTGIADDLTDIVQKGDFLIGAASNAVIVTPDMVAGPFVSHAANGPGSYNVTGISAGGASAVVIGQGSTPNGICVSPDNVTWHNLPAVTFSTQGNTFSTANSIIFDGSQFVAVAGTRLGLSPDGSTWTITLFSHTTTATVIGYDIGNQIGNYYVGDASGNVFVSATAAGLATAAATNITTRPLRCATTTNGIALFGDDQGNVYQSSDGGVTWTTEHPGLGTLVLTAMANFITP
jgi:hypothetical protein